MPRKPRSGYTEKKAAVQPARTPTGLPQGENKKLREAQQAIPLPNNQGRMQLAMQAIQGGGEGMLGAGDMLSQPTQRPGEPIQAGMPMGPGPGVSAVQPPIVPATQDDFNMAQYLPMLEALADRPDATVATRNFVRRMRGVIPPEITMESLVNNVNPQPGR